MLNNNNNFSNNKRKIKAKKWNLNNICNCKEVIQSNSNINLH